MKASTTLEARLSQEKVKEVYDGLARIYDAWGALTEGRARRRGIELSRIQKGESVLDVAVGTGLILADLVKLNPTGLNAGIDISGGMLQKARARLKDSPARVELKQASAFEIPYPAAAFDLVMNGYMFDLMPVEAMPKILTEYRRVLKPGGRLVLVNMTRGVHFYQQFWEGVYKLNPRWLGGCRGVLLSDSLKAAGFRSIQREMISQFGFPSEIISAII